MTLEEALRELGVEEGQDLDLEAEHDRISSAIASLVMLDMVPHRSMALVVVIGAMLEEARGEDPDEETERLYEAHRIVSEHTSSTYLAKAATKSETKKVGGRFMSPGGSC